MTAGIGLQATLLRGFALDFLSCHDVAVVPRIMHPDYRLAIGDHLFEGRDQVYLPATAAQLAQFPGLCVTVHDVLLGSDFAAMRFTEHGVSARHGRAAAWGGVTLFRIVSGQLWQGWADEDYFARKRQLATGRGDAVAAPHAAPWDVAVAPPQAVTARVVSDWLQDPHAFAARFVEQIAAEGPSWSELIEVDDFCMEELWSAGDRAAFRVRARGRYVGGFTDLAASRGAPIVITATGLATVDGGRVSRVQVAYDRLGLHRSFTDKK